MLLLARSNLYHAPKSEGTENLRFMEFVDKQFLETPWYGSRMWPPSRAPSDAVYAIGNPEDTARRILPVCVIRARETLPRRGRFG